jgi:hypothetical protein
LTSSGRGLPTAEYVEPWVTPRKHTSFIDKVNLKFASLERSEGHEEPIVSESDIRSCDRREKRHEKGRLVVRIHDKQPSFADITFRYSICNSQGVVI